MKKIFKCLIICNIWGKFEKFGFIKRRDNIAHEK